MKSPRLKSPLRPLWLALALLAGGAVVSMAQTTNWIAYNDHRPFTTPTVPPSWGFTASNVTTLNMGAPTDESGPLINFLNGSPLSASVSFTRTGSPDDFGTVGRPLSTNSPMGRLFYRICDLANDGIVGVRAVPPNTSESYVTITFGGLDPSKRYVFRGAAVRNGGYGNRWSIATIAAQGWTDAHIPGATGPGVLTANNFPSGGFTAGQAAWNSGANNEGAVVGWNDIAPQLDGTFTIVTKQYTGAIPGGTANGPYGYGFSAFMLAEVEIVAPTITANPPPTTTVEQNRPFSLSVAATGAPLNYQWYKRGQPDVEISGATFPTYSIAQAQVADSGNYYAVVFNSLARRTSTVAQVTVFADTTAPTVESIFSYPTVDANGVATLDQIIIEFNEPVTPASVSSPTSYTVPGGGNPSSVIVTNDRTVVLVLSTPLAEDTAYSVTLSGATDSVGNVAGPGNAPFRSWASGPGNGLLMESYNVADPAITVESLLASPNYPDNPFQRDTLRAFDSRLVFPDDTREAYGARIRGVFIPPVSGNWAFFARTRNLGLLRLNPNGTDPAGAVEILRQSTENAPFNWDRLSSSLFFLRAGRAYYIEGLYKGATGPDFLKVAARLAGTGAPTPVDTPDTQVDSNSLAGASIAFPLAPRNLGGTLSIVQDVADVSVENLHDATFSIVLDNPSALPLFYQWFRDGAPISGANGPTYTFQAQLADNNAQFSVQVSKVGASLTSRTARLSVRADTTRPQVESVTAPDLTNVIVRFNERVNTADATEAFNYDFGIEISVFGATLGADGRTVTISLGDPLVSGQTYTVRISTIRDLADLFINPDPTVVQFVAGTPPPRLSITRSGNQVSIAWPASATGFTLESTSALTTPENTIVWTPVGTAPTVVNGNNVVTLSAGPGHRFFRLRR